jgi:hypothetical protein
MAMMHKHPIYHQNTLLISLDYPFKGLLFTLCNPTSWNIEAPPYGTIAELLLYCILCINLYRYHNKVC